MPKCRICNASPQEQRIRAESVYGGGPEHKFWQCRQCDAVYLYPVPSVEEERRFYREEFAKFMASRSGEDRDWSTAEAHVKTNQDQVSRRWVFLKDYLRQEMNLLEIGCSSGFMLNAFRAHGMHCVGVEPSGEFLEFLHRNRHIAYRSIEELREKEPNRKFDLIVHFFVFEHIRDPFVFLEETLKLLKLGGRMIAEVPCVHDPLTSIYDIPAFETFYWSIAHHYYYSPKSMSYILNRLNLKSRLIPEQRYDLSNHIIWMTKGKPGGQDKYNHVFSKELLNKYKQDLKDRWLCDTMFVIIEN